MITRMIFSVSDTSSRIFIGVLVIAAAYVTVANLFVSPTSAFHVPTHIVALLGKYLCYAILAVALDLVWGGYAGRVGLEIPPTIEWRILPGFPRRIGAEPGAH